MRRDTRARRGPARRSSRSAAAVEPAASPSSDHGHDIPGPSRRVDGGQDVDPSVRVDTGLAFARAVPAQVEDEDPEPAPASRSGAASGIQNKAGLMHEDDGQRSRPDDVTAQQDLVLGRELNRVAAHVGHRSSGVNGWKQATSRTPVVSTGTSSQQRSAARLQRGAKAHRVGGSTALAISPPSTRCFRPWVPSMERHLERRGVWMARVLEDVRRRPALHDAAHVHHRGAGRKVADDRQVMADEQVRQPEPLLQVAQEVDDLALHRHIERAHWLVEDQKLRVRPRWRMVSSRCAAAGPLRIRAGIDQGSYLADGPCPAARWHVGVGPPCPPRRGAYPR